MYKIGVIGSIDTVLGFKAVGLDVFTAAGLKKQRKPFISWQRKIMRLFISQKIWRQR